MTTELPQVPGYDTYREIKALMDAGVDEEQAVATVYAALRSTNGAVAESEARLRAESDLKFTELRTSTDIKFTELKTSYTDMQASNDIKFAELQASQDKLGKDLTIRLLAVVLPVTGLLLAAIGAATGLIIYALG